MSEHTIICICSNYLITSVSVLKMGLNKKPLI